MLAAWLMVGISALTVSAATKGTNDSETKGRESTTARMVDIVGHAGELVKYARENESPTAMLAAVEMIRRVPLGEPARAAFGTKKSEGEAALARGVKNPAPAPTFEIVSLLNEAKAWVRGNATLAGLIEVELARPTAQAGGGTLGARGGVKYVSEKVEAGRSDVYDVTFVGGESAAVMVIGDGDTDLDLYIYDEDGNLITKDDDDSDNCIVGWTPRWTGKFTIKIKNLGRVYNAYMLMTN